MAKANDLMVKVVKPDGKVAEVSLRRLLGDVLVDKLLAELGVVQPGGDE